MAKNRNDYFKMAEEQITYCVQASGFLEKIVCNYNPANIISQKKRMHDIEHKADELHHDILTRLSREFITPIDQEDILRLVQIIDDVTDALDEVVLELYMFHVDTIPDAAPELARLVDRCVNALYESVKELKNFKKPERLRGLLVEVNHNESRADAVYNEAIYVLFGRGDISGKVLMGHKAIYDSLENCCDLCEHAADIIEQIVIKNT